jgi:molybdopterin synthase catalytic subunit
MLEHYPDMTEREIARQAEEAARRWPLLGVTVIHRIGELKPGEAIVLVVVAAEHRSEAFAACAFLMDQLKTKATLWKQEKRLGGTTEWVEANPSDDKAAERWTK